MKKSVHSSFLTEGWQLILSCTRAKPAKGHRGPWPMVFARRPACQPKWMAGKGGD